MFAVASFRIVSASFLISQQSRLFVCFDGLTKTFCPSFHLYALGDRYNNHVNETLPNVYWTPTTCWVTVPHTPPPTFAFSIALGLRRHHYCWETTKPWGGPVSRPRSPSSKWWREASNRQSLVFTLCYSADAHLFIFFSLDPKVPFLNVTHYWSNKAVYGCLVSFWICSHFVKAYFFT